MRDLMLEIEELEGRIAPDYMPYMMLTGKIEFNGNGPGYPGWTPHSNYSQDSCSGMIDKQGDGWDDLGNYMDVGFTSNLLNMGYTEICRLNGNHWVVR